MARKRAKRTRLATGIFQDTFGISVMVQRGGTRTEVRFPLGTPLEELRTRRRELAEDLGESAPRTRAGTLRADVARALTTIPTGRYRDTVSTLLEHWLAAAIEIDGEVRTFGQTPRSAITALHVKTQLAVFSSATTLGERRRFSPKTVKELRRVLGWVYTALDGPDAANPVRGVRAPRVAYDDPRGIDYAIIERIFAEMPDRGRPQDGPAGGRRGATERPTIGLTKLRLRVMAYTGLHQVEVMRLAPGHVDLRQRRLWISARQKGAGAAGAWHRLTSPAVDALRAFLAADAFGAFSTRSMARTWTLAVAAARATWDREQAGTRRPAPWPVHADARPYDLRHSLGTAVYLETGDIRAAQEILRHRQIATTLRYTHAGVSERAERAKAALERRFAALPQSASTRVGKNAQKRPPTLSARGRTATTRSRRKPRKIA